MKITRPDNHYDSQRNMFEHKIHPILDCPNHYRLVEFKYVIDWDEPRQSFIQMRLRHHDDEVSLRFWQPVNLSIEAGFPFPTGGMVFYDRSADSLQDIGIEVADFESSHGSILFSAREVERI
ncbi:hypothetical protein [Massilia sp. TWP1-3-3]|uniref:hypothetical protein n=1 Tax=Massilia sp. TWP1-3-3 TaxID=2804573 RepID=UPI003CF9CB45